MCIWLFAHCVLHFASKFTTFGCDFVLSGSETSDSRHLAAHRGLPWDLECNNEDSKAQTAPELGVDASGIISALDLQD
jgi:hypothetical protein